MMDKTYLYHLLGLHLRLKPLCKALHRHIGRDGFGLKQLAIQTDKTEGVDGEVVFLRLPKRFLAELKSRSPDCQTSTLLIGLNYFSQSKLTR